MTHRSSIYEATEGLLGIGPTGDNILLGAMCFFFVLLVVAVIRQRRRK